ncbi:hypothetical protein HMPREF9080_02985, partial [Cardiobacterium valvarum F0432]
MLDFLSLFPARQVNSAARRESGIYPAWRLLLLCWVCRGDAVFILHFNALNMAVAFRQVVAFMAARGVIVVAFAGADGHFLFAAVQGDVASARIGADMAKAYAVLIVVFFGDGDGLAAFAFAEFGDFGGIDEGNSAF